MEAETAAVEEHVAGLADPFEHALRVGLLPAVGGHQVEQAVVVQVHRHGAPAPAAVVHPRGLRQLAEAVLSLVDVQHVAVVLAHRAAVGVDRGEVPVEQAVVVEVADRAAHAVGRAVGARGPGLVDERAGAVVAAGAAVAQVAAGAEVGRDQQLRVAVAVHVHERRREGPDREVGGNGRGGVGEAHRLAAEVAVEPVALRLGVGGDEQVQVAVAVVVAEGGAHGVGPVDDRSAHPDLRGDVVEDGHAAVLRGPGVVVQAVLPDPRRPVRRPQAGHEQVLPAVPVVVAHRRRDAAVVRRQAGRRGVVAEGAVAVVEVQRIRRAPAAEQEQVLPAVAVEVPHRGAAGHVGEGERQRLARRHQPGAHGRLPKRECLRPRPRRRQAQHQAQHRTPGHCCL